MTVTPRTRRFLILIPLGLALLAGAAQGIQYMWRHGYSHGERTGLVRKISVKGPPYCKYLSGELVLAGNSTLGQAEVWEFTADDDDEDNPMVVTLHEAERAGTRVTLKYRQDKPLWWTCNPIEYKVLDVVR